MADHSVEEAFWEMATTDIEDALDLLRPTYDESDGEDGFVSLEVSPALAHDTEGTVRDPRKLRDAIEEPNLLVKVPATLAGVPAITRRRGPQYQRHAHLRARPLRRGHGGLPARPGGARRRGPVERATRVASVASFFVSRVDTEVDRRLEALAGGDGTHGSGDAAVLAQRGTAAVAQAQVAYQHFHRTFAGERWEALASLGARVQRPLWASTSTKNPAYSDLLYVDNLIGPSSVNTMPEPTLRAFEDHGTLHRTVDADPDAAEAVLARLGETGVDMEDVEQTLEDEGVHAFVKSFDELLQSLTDKAATF